jgi:hypothetical protein
MQAVSLDHEKRSAHSRELALKLYDRWVRERQNRPPIHSSDNLKEMERIAKQNFATQLVEPRKQQLAELKEVKANMDFPDQVALLAMMELPVLETSTLLHRLSRQVAADPAATYFSKVNLADNCGCGCGCGCAAMANLDYQDRVVLHYQAKPYSVDPFNELGIPVEVRDKMLATEFMQSFQALAETVGSKVNQRYYRMAQEFA